jgi:glutamine cyclotransferase
MNRPKAAAKSGAEIVREYGPFPGADQVAGVTFDGTAVWFAAGNAIRSFDPVTGREGRKLAVPGDAGTAFDGRHLFQLAGDRILEIDPATGAIVSTLPAPASQGALAGLTWAEGKLWVAVHGEGKIHQIDPQTGRVLRTIESTRFVTGVTFVEGDLWHGTWEGDASDLRRVDATTGELLETVEMPPGSGVSGLESNGRDIFYCGGGRSGKVRALRRVRQT